MTPYQWFRLAVYGIGLPIIVYLILSVGRRIRAIRELDARLRAEDQRGIADPYAGMARIHEAQEILQRARRGK